LIRSLRAPAQRSTPVLFSFEAFLVDHGLSTCHPAIKNDCRAIRDASAARTIWIADAHRDGKRFVVRADEKLTAFMELESAIHRRFE
jgi:hypothetical protein